MRNKQKRIWIDNHEARIKALESLCAKNDSSHQIIKEGKKKGINNLKWYLILLIILIQTYLLIRISL